MKKKSKSKRKLNLYEDSWNYLKESKNFIYSAIILFLIGIIVGFIFPSYFSDFFDPIIRDLIDKTSGLTVNQLIFFIFQNNLIASFLALILGIFIGVFPIFNIVVNGTLLGYVLSKAVEVEGIFTIWRLIPHGIFELPAIFIAVGLGIKLGFSWFFKGNKIEELKKRFLSSLKVFVAIILPLLIIAAVVEGILIALSG